MMNSLRAADFESFQAKFGSYLELELKDVLFEALIQ